MKKAVVFTLLALVLGCGGGAPSEGAEEPASGSDETATEETATEESASSGGQGKASAAELLGITPPDKPWAEMSHEDKEWYMVGKVMPIMKEQFQAHDAETFGEFACETCHGPDGKERDWKMPADHLPPIYPADHPKTKEMNEQKGEMVAFMATEVTPTMMTLLGLDPYDPKSGKGFGCFGCHPAGE